MVQHIFLTHPCPHMSSTAYGVMDQMHLFQQRIDGVTCCKKPFMQRPLKASFIGALQQRERICQMRNGDLLALESAPR